MTKRHHSWMAVLGLFPLVLVGFTLFRSDGDQAQAQGQGQFPIMDQIANKVVQKYANSTCEQLVEAKVQHAPPSMAEQRAIGLLKSDPQMRAAFINKVAPPIANKMFECGLIP